MSFSVARFLMDSFEWEYIHEWVTVHVNEWKFDVFVKEFGSEVYSRQCHPNEAEMAYMGTGGRETETESIIEETPHEKQNLPAMEANNGGEDSNNLNVISVPRIETTPKEINEAIDEVSTGAKEPMQREAMEMERREDEGGNPMNEEMERVMGLDADVDLDTVNNLGLKEVVVYTNGLEVSPVRISHNVRLGNNNGSDPTPSDSDSCPYPPGFGPCSSEVHVHSSVRVRSERQKLQQKGREGCRSEEEGEQQNLDQSLQEGIVGDTLTEAIKTKHVCEIGGFRFKGDDNNTILETIGGAEKREAEPKRVNSDQSKLSARSSDGYEIPLAFLVGKLKKPKKANVTKKWEDNTQLVSASVTTPKKQKVVKTGLNLKGRYLSTRILRSGPNSKLR
ncbi:hypothetical protein PIB30_053390 [Stylosanthes scabra]|uniref:Uncharacterized protein n=1 Tax=Stylosanthes scabra TaxID=79078 RepID=A0ABU6TJD2_9FABA|nr:hypothetical protein [Stylosanthes scabra]